MMHTMATIWNANTPTHNDGKAVLIGLVELGWRKRQKNKEKTQMKTKLKVKTT